MKLHVDLETFSDVDIRKFGVYKYCESPSFEILLFGYTFGGMLPQVVDLARGEKIPTEVLAALRDEAVILCAHNANFERTALRRHGIDLPAHRWECSQVKAAYAGLPLSLSEVSKALDLGKKAKSNDGTALIRYFCVPQKPTKTKQKLRNFPEDSPEKWEKFKDYCAQDVLAEMEVCARLEHIRLPETEKKAYVLDQKINDRGIKIDLKLVQNAINLDTEHSAMLKLEMKRKTGLDNPNSVAQLKDWLREHLGEDFDTLGKKQVDKILASMPSEKVTDVLRLRQMASKTSNKKYLTMMGCVMADSRIRGLLQFYGAMRTGRWAGRLVQMQNLPRNFLKDIETARKFLLLGSYEAFACAYADVADTISQLIRTAFVSDTGFSVCDFSAIEARVLAWLAGEKWRMDVFNTHGKIYEASASKMFKVALELVTKGSDYRARGKVAELALGYGGGEGALEQMGAAEMGVPRSEWAGLVSTWREENTEIVTFWKAINYAAIKAVKTGQPQILQKYKGLKLYLKRGWLIIALPSGREMYYYQPRIIVNRFGGDSVAYMGIDTKTKKWTLVDTYGGKLCENVTQAIARDLLTQAMLRLDANGYDTVLHVHDEVVAENTEREKMEKLMAVRPEWALDLPLGADGFFTKYYKKD